MANKYGAVEIEDEKPATPRVSKYGAVPIDKEFGDDPADFAALDAAYRRQATHASPVDRAPGPVTRTSTITGRTSIEGAPSRVKPVSMGPGEAIWHSTMGGGFRGAQVIASGTDALIDTINESAPGRWVNQNILGTDPKPREPHPLIADQLPPLSDDPDFLERYGRARTARELMAQKAREEYPNLTAMTDTALQIATVFNPAARAVGTLQAVSKAAPTVAGKIAAIGASPAGRGAIGALAAEGALVGGLTSDAQIVDETGDIHLENLPALAWDTAKGAGLGIAGGTGFAVAPKATAATLATLSGTQAAGADNDYDRARGFLETALAGGAIPAARLAQKAGEAADAWAAKNFGDEAVGTRTSSPGRHMTPTKQIDEEIAHWVNDRLDEEFKAGQQQIKTAGEAEIAERKALDAQHAAAVAENIDRTLERQVAANLDARAGRRGVENARATEDFQRKTTRANETHDAATARNEKSEQRVGEDEAFRKYQDELSAYERESRDATRKLRKAIQDEVDDVRLREKFAGMAAKERQALIDQKNAAVQKLEDLKNSKAGDFAKKAQEAYQTLTNYFVQHGRRMEDDFPHLEPQIAKVRAMFDRNAPGKMDFEGRTNAAWDSKIAAQEAEIQKATEAVDAYQPPDIDAQVAAARAPKPLPISSERLKALAHAAGVRLPDEFLQRPTDAYWDGDLPLLGRDVPSQAVPEPDRFARSREDIGARQAQADTTYQRRLEDARRMVDRKQEDLRAAALEDQRRERARIERKNAGMGRQVPDDGNWTEAEMKAFADALGAQARLLPDEGIAPFDLRQRARELSQTAEEQRFDALRLNNEQIGIGGLIRSAARAVGKTGPQTGDTAWTTLLRTRPGPNGIPEYVDPYAATIVKRRLEKIFRKFPQMAIKHGRAISGGLSPVLLWMYLDRNPDLAAALEQETDD